MNYDNNFRQVVEKEVNNLANNQDLQNTENLSFNIDYQESELGGAIYRFQLGKSPGSNSLYPEMLNFQKVMKKVNKQCLLDTPRTVRVS